MKPKQIRIVLQLSLIAFLFVFLVPVLPYRIPAMICPLPPGTGLINDWGCHPVPSGRYYTGYYSLGLVIFKWGALWNPPAYYSVMSIGGPAFLLTVLSVSLLSVLLMSPEIMNGIRHLTSNLNSDSKRHMELSYSNNHLIMSKWLDKVGVLMMTRGKIALLGLATGLVIIGAGLAIFGASYTVTSCTGNGGIYTLPAGSVFRGFYPIWSPPVRNTVLVCGNFTPQFSTVNYTVSYTLNYLGIMIVIMALMPASVLAFVNRQSNTSRQVVEERKITETIS